MPTYREHDTDGFTCWCEPVIYRMCEECKDGCWACERGMVAISVEEAERHDSPVGLLTVHSDPDEGDSEE